jgi:predicted AAA+ superfamily ATPase
MTQMLDRLIHSRLARGKKSILLLGPRQVGKSTLTRQLKPYRVINLASQALFLAYSKDAGRLERELASLPPASLVVIDEIQRIPALLNSVQAVLDEGSTLRFILTGSSARSLRRRGVNLLPGRVILEHLDSLLFWEMGDSFDLHRALQVGTLPGVYLDLEHGADTLGTYATVYLHEEIQAEAAVRNLGDYARFLDAAAQSSGLWINYSKWASDLEIAKETVRRYVAILHDTLLTVHVPAYRPKSSVRHVSQRDRFLFFDVGVRNALLGLHTQPPTQTEYGGVFEQWFILQCIGYIRAHRKPWRWYAYRTDTGAEVDLILDIGTRLIAIEIKWGESVSARACLGLKSFMRVADKPVQAFIVGRWPHRQCFDEAIAAVPYQEFLREVLVAL